MSSGAVLFFENFHGHLSCEGPACGNGLAWHGSFFATHASLHVLMFGASLANCFATWRTAIAQSGRLSCGSLLTNQLRRSAIRQSFVAGRPAAARVRQCALAGQRTAARSRGFRHRWLALEVGIAKLEGIKAVTINVLRHRPKKSYIAALHRPLRIRQNLWQSR